MDQLAIKIPGLLKDDFVVKYGEEALTRVSLSRVISWNHKIYILDELETKNDHGVRDK